MKKSRLLSAILILTLTLITIFSTIPTAFAAERAPITYTVNLANITKNARGDGFEWANLTNTLTLDNLNINTADEYGLKLPKEATVILKGNNTITAGSIGLSSLGQVTFEGNGTLTIIAGDIGIDLVGTNTSNLARFSDGKITITAGTAAIRSEKVEIDLYGSDVTMNITGNSENRKAVSGRNVSLNGGSVTANASIYASNTLTVTATNTSITSTSSALECPNGIKMNKVSISAGDSADTLSAKDTYSGEKAIALKSTATNKKVSILFGGNVPKAIDYIVFIILIAATATLIILPIYLKKKKTEKLIAEYKAQNQAKKNKPSSKKSK